MARDHLFYVVAPSIDTVHMQAGNDCLTAQKKGKKPMNGLSTLAYRANNITLFSRSILSVNKNESANTVQYSAYI